VICDVVVTIDAGQCDAVLFDLDGVITDTVSIHQAAWKHLFDDYLARRPERVGEDQRWFTDGDYRRYVDGKPRYNGVADFLRSRGIGLSWGRTSDSDDAETVCGLGNRKNRYFRECLDHDGVSVFESTVDLIWRLRNAGVGAAVFSSSRNCQAVLEAVGLGDLFPVRVDGVVADRLGLPGKPDPSVLVEATRRLGADPARCVVVEDAEAGVEAGQRGGFALVIGVDRTGHADQLRQHGADVVVADLAEVEVQPVARRLSAIPDALTSWHELIGMLGHRRPAIFLDFDGTLSDIVDDPDAATLIHGADTVLQHLARCCPVAVVSGRDLRDVRRRVRVPGIWFAGSHGFELTGPHGQHYEHSGARAMLPALDRAAAALRERLADVPGVLIERKRFAVAAHYRTVAAERVGEVGAAVREVAQRYDHLRVSSGRKVSELRPESDWDKGQALRWLLERMANGRAAVPIYAGDDLTDEDAIETVRASGIGIVVRQAEHGDRRSAAHFAVNGPDELRKVLHRLADLLDTARKVGR